MPGIRHPLQGANPWTGFRKLRPVRFRWVWRVWRERFQFEVLKGNCDELLGGAVGAFISKETQNIAVSMFATQLVLKLPILQGSALFSGSHRASFGQFPAFDNSAETPRVAKKREVHPTSGIAMENRPFLDDTFNEILAVPVCKVSMITPLPSSSGMVSAGLVPWISLSTPPRGREAGGHRQPLADVTIDETFETYYFWETHKNDQKWWVSVGLFLDGQLLCVYFVTIFVSKCADLDTPRGGMTGWSLTSFSQIHGGLWQALCRHQQGTF